MNTNLEILTIQENGGTDLQENSCWYYYKAKQNNKILESFIILPENLANDELTVRISEHIQERGFDKFVALNKVSPRIKELIEACHSSENEMWFIEHDDEEWSQIPDEEFDKLQEEIDDLDLHLHIELEHNIAEEFKDALVTVYGGISSVVNFYEEA